MSNRHFALYDANSGMYKWFGTAKGIAEAIRLFDKEVGGLQVFGARRLGVDECTEEQISAIKRWVSLPSKNEFPKDLLRSSLVFDAMELELIIKQLEFISDNLLCKLGNPMPRNRT